VLPILWLKICEKYINAVSNEKNDHGFSNDINSYSSVLLYKTQLSSNIVSSLDHILKSRNSFGPSASL